MPITPRWGSKLHADSQPIGQALTFCAFDDASGALFIINVVANAIVIAIFELCRIAVQVLVG